MFLIQDVFDSLLCKMFQTVTEVSQSWHSSKNSSSKKLFVVLMFDSKRGAVTPPIAILFLHPVVQVNFAVLQSCQ